MTRFVWSVDDLPQVWGITVWPEAKKGYRWVHGKDKSSNEEAGVKP